MPYPPIAMTPKSAISRYDHGVSDDGGASALAGAVGPLGDWAVVGGDRRHGSVVGEALIDASPRRDGDRHRQKEQTERAGPRPDDRPMHRLPRRASSLTSLQVWNVLGSHRATSRRARPAPRSNNVPCDYAREMGSGRNDPRGTDPGNTG